MGRIHRYGIVTGITLSMLAMPAFSASFFTSNELGRKGVYLLGGAGYGGNTKLPAEVTAGNDVTFNSRINPARTVGQVGAGYQFSDYFSVQADYLLFQDDDSSGYDLIFYYVSVPNYYKLTGGDLLAKFMFPSGKYFTLNGYIGAIVAHENAYNLLYVNAAPLIDRTSTNVMPTIGAGAELYFLKYFSLGISYFYAASTGNINAIQYVPVTLAFHF